MNDRTRVAWLVVNKTSGQVAEVHATKRNAKVMAAHLSGFIRPYDYVPIRVEYAVPRRKP